MNPRKMFGDRPCLVALQRADEMPFQIEVCRGARLVDRFLNVIFPECPLSGLMCGDYAVDRPRLADGQQRNFLG